MSLKVVHINTSHKGGAGIATLRLHNALHKANIKSAFLSKGLSIDFKNETVDDTFFEYKQPTLVRRIINKIAPGKTTSFIKKFNKIKSDIDCEIVSLPISNYKLHNHPFVLEADIVNLHWVGDLIDYPTFFKNVSKPIVWTMHDMNPFKGIFHYETDAYKNSNFAATEEKMFSLKRKHLLCIDKGACLSPSKWLLDEAAKTNMFSSFKIQNVIPNSIEINSPEHHIQKEKSRKLLGLNNDDHVLLFISGSLDIERKGFVFLQEALEDMKSSLTLLTVGHGEVSIKNNNITLKPLGFLSDTSKIAEAYNAADAVVLPSIEDNLPNTMLEALSYARPVISFKVGGIQEHIKEPMNGVLAKTISSQSLKQAIEDFINKKERFDPEKIITYAKHHFSFQNQASKYIELYKQLQN
ncbi:glycosyltransferase [Winogradskyella sp.]|uniref:glycosyltransferase n=1 Tax=Winogradskyella sp. TaxID=1883156 RepID=UPI00260DD7F8|nr:glycosyltransferase [Winogradskyella sp.]